MFGRNIKKHEMFQTIGWSIVGAFVGANSGRWELKMLRCTLIPSDDVRLEILENTM